MRPARGTTPGKVESLHPIESHDPDVHEQRPGFSVHDVMTNGRCHWFTGDNWVRLPAPPAKPETAKIRIYLDLSSAQRVATMYHGIVSTVPRWNGHVWCWGEAP